MEKPSHPTTPTPFYYELELIHPVETYLKKQGYRVKHEIKIGYCRADLIGIKNDTIIAIELKLREWKKAIIQAKNYQLGADLVYIAIPLLRAPTLLRKKQHILENEGIGLLTINEQTSTVKELLPAQPSKRKMGSITQHHSYHQKQRPKKFRRF
jgi:hypothetical protein